MSEDIEKHENLSALQRAVVALKTMRARLEKAENPQDQPIAIVGLGCRFPGTAIDPEAYWKLLEEGKDTSGEVPKDRFDIDEFYDPTPSTPGRTYCRRGSFLEHIDQFSPEFFRIAPREAEIMDPQQRLLLEVAWEALEDAGQAGKLENSSTGVFVGGTTMDYGTYVARAALPDNAHYGPGNTLNSIAGRISYVLGLHGPCMAVDTACSSSLVSVHLASQSLRLRECDLALAGGVNILLSPEVMVNISQAGVLAPDGRCKTFAEAADGYGRGEGCGLVVLKRLDDAVRDRNQIYGVLLGSAVNHDGASGGFTVPNGSAQQALLRRAWRNAGVAPADLDYIEAHGTGTPLGDPIEIQALDAVLREGRTKGDRLLVGSMKTNLGHLEASAGVAALMKVVLGLQHGRIPAHLHFDRPSPHIRWDQSLLKVSDRPAPWVRSTRPRVAGVSAFGLSGTNAHVVVSEPPLRETPDEPASGGAHALTLSAKTEAALRTTAFNLANHVQSHPELSLADVCFALNSGRATLQHRMSMVVEDRASAIDRLLSFAGGATDGIIYTQTSRRHAPRVAFVFSGQGTLDPSTCDQLFETQPVFREALIRCNELLQPSLDRSVLELLRQVEGIEAALMAPATFAFEYSLAMMWISWGVSPACLMGVGTGEYTAACVGGALSLEHSVDLVLGRMRAMRLSGSGTASAILRVSEGRAKSCLAQVEGLELSVIVAPEIVVVSGALEQIEQLVALATSDGIEVERFEEEFAVRPSAEALGEFQKVADNVKPEPPSIRIVSSVTGRVTEKDELGRASYWMDHLVRPASLERALRELVARNTSALLEVGLASTVMALARPVVEREGILCRSTVNRGASDSHHIQESIGALWAHGVDVTWEAVDREPSRRRVSLPTYPFERRRCWVEDDIKPHSVLTPTADSKANGTPSHPAPDAQFELRWIPNGFGDRGDAAVESSRWIVLADNAGAAEKIAEALADSGAGTVIVRPDSKYVNVANDSITLDPRNPEHFERLVADVLVGPGPWFILHAWGANVSTEGSAELGPDLELMLSSSLSLCQALERASGHGARIWWATRGAQQVGDSKARIAPAAGSLFGFVRALASESPQMWGGIVDLDPQATPEQCAVSFLDALASEAEDQFAYRDGQRFHVRLQVRESLETHPVVLRADGTYLITGGLGGLGLEFANWLVTNGAKSVVLLGRSGAALPAAKEALVRLRQSGARIRVVKADIASPKDVDKVFEDLAASMPPLAGVIHAAGILHEALVPKLDWEGFDRVLQPKVAGAWNLHRATAALDLDFFVLFSSAAVLGGSGQSSYAAGNSFLDALADFRRQRGLPALSIQWGPWRETGMAAGLDIDSHWRRQGTEPLSTEGALRAFERALSSNWSQSAVLRFHWERLFSPELPFAGWTLMRDLLPVQSEREPKSQPETQATLQAEVDLRSSLAQGTPETRARLVEDYVGLQIGGVIGYSSSADIEKQTPLIDLGMDSLMAVQLRNNIRGDLEINVSIGELLEGISLEQLAARILDRLQERSEGTSIGRAPTSDEPTK